MTTLPAGVLAQIRAVGRGATPESYGALTDLLAPLQEERGYLAPRVERDLSYGSDPRHLLDVHTPDSPAAEAAPVLLFVHGGAHVYGDKSDPKTPWYDHIGGWAVRHGMVGVNMTYRLAPRHQWPSGAEDIAAAVAWTRKNIAEYGGNPDRIVLMGQSAGATNAASYLAGDGGAGADDLAGAVLLSGIYDPPTAERNFPLTVYYGEDASMYAEQSAVSGLVRSQVPMLVGVAELDLPDFHRQALGLLDAMLAAHGVIPPFVTVPGHTHLSEILVLGLDDESFGDDLARFVHSVSAVGARDAPR
ncbi:alpha/beta hydrolase [Streptomyces sp. NPDC088921]|uniref:alpha/beta hydrolase n=1 Tax=unclassified Streptomyces TaxID=2593676 RepID=UPI003415B716